MPALIAQPTRITAAGNKPKQIDEYIGRVNSGDEASASPTCTARKAGSSPARRRSSDEYTIVLRGLLRVASREGVLEVRAGQAVVVRRGEWVQYSTPGPDGAEYLAVCVPAFAPATVHRDPDDAARS